MIPASSLLMAPSKETQSIGKSALLPTFEYAVSLVLLAVISLSDAFEQTPSILKGLHSISLSIGYIVFL
jgi:hypothetical protein